MALGTLPAERVLRAYLERVLYWRSHGTSWDQIAALLRDAAIENTTIGATAVATIKPG
jgi:hypothetical protein